MCYERILLEARNENEHFYTLIDKIMKVTANLYRMILITLHRIEVGTVVKGYED